MKIRILFVLAVLLISGNVQAGVSTFLCEKSYGECSIKVTHEAATGADNGVLTIRSRNKKNSACNISKQQAREVLYEGIKIYVNIKNSKFALADSIFLGRIKNYPWMSEHLVKKADKSGVWDKKTGRPSDRSANAYVSLLLSDREVLFYFNLVLEQIGYGVAGVSCEKVLINKDKLPYDAMCWLNIDRITSIYGG